MKIKILLLALALISVSFAPIVDARSYTDDSQYRNHGQYMKSLKSNKNKGRGNNSSYYYSYNQGSNIAYIQQLYALIQDLQDELENLQYGSGYGRDYRYSYDSNYYYNDNNRNSDIDVTTLSARSVDDDSAILRGEVDDLRRNENAWVYFEYGRSRNRLTSDTTRIRIDDDDSEVFSRKLIRLSEDTTYYFRAVAEDEDGDRDRGSIKSFRTDDDNRNNHNNNDDEPDVDTDDADDVDEDSAELNGSVDMNDFNNGIVFFVYGEDEDQVEDIEDDYDEFNDIDEDGDDLQKIRVDRDIDGQEDYHRDIRNLDDDTDYYYAICVEYEDEDDDETIDCGSVELFTTDRD